jgi:hypothetical protein
MTSSSRPRVTTTGCTATGPNRQLRRLAGLIGLAATAALLVAPAQSHAYSRTGSKFRGHTITYYNSIKAYDPAVKAAASAWNKSGAKIRFKRASKKKARVKFKFMPAGSCNGETRLLRARITTHATVRVPPFSAPESCRDTATLTIVVAHEFGHVLGLGHERKVCALMNPNGNRDGGTLCDPTGTTPPWMWRCRVIEPDDLRGAIKIYGGKYRSSKFAASPLCPLYAAPPPVLGLTASDSGADNYILVSMTRPADGVVPGYLLQDFPGGAPFTYVAYAAGTCPAITAATRYSWDGIAVGGRLVDGVISGPSLATGQYCVSIWAADAIGQPSVPATAFVHIG